MKTFAATEAKTNFGALLDAAQRGPVGIKKNGRRVARLISEEDCQIYDQLWDAEVHRKIKEGLKAGDEGRVVDGPKFMAKMLAKYTSLAAKHTQSK